MAVKSFQGQRAEQTDKGAPIMVKDYMAKKLVSFKPDQSVVEAMEILVKNKISGGPVIDDQDELVGIISEGDCLKQISQSKYFNMPMSDIKVKDYMVKEVKTMDAFVTIFEAADYFLNNKIRRFPVMRHGKLVGQISQKDILEAVLKVKH
ncbi:MAG: CBS domain-containing protein [Bacteroidetes bacterium]|nr:CBS domain-containing protein [Bacteroidota bacterium]